MKAPATLRTTCRACPGKLDPLLDLGPIVPSDFLRPDQPDPPPIPLALDFCHACGLVQLNRTTDPESLFRQYWYHSGVNEVMRAELADIVEKTAALVGGWDRRDTVVDIGANDGTLLSCISGPLRIAYEPAHNLIPALTPHADAIYNGFFPAGNLTTRSAKAIFSIAMFYDLDNPRAFVEEIDRILADDGVWVVQFQDLAQMVETTAFDNVVAEHLCYYSVQTFASLLGETGLQIVRVEPRAINGGSVRIYVRRNPTSGDLPLSWLAYEETLTSPLALEKFAWQVGERRRIIQEMVRVALDRYGFIDMYGASTKASTLLQYCGLDYRQIRQAAERTPEKHGLVTAGTRIPIVNEHTWRSDPAPVSLAVIWQFCDMILQREAEYLQQGGQFIFPLPVTRIVSYGQQVERPTGTDI